MDITRIKPSEARRLHAEEGYALLDVRSMPEFAEGHAAGAYNIPFLHKTPSGMIPNQDFAQVVRDTFPDTATKIVTNCKMGGRSMRAAAELKSLGYTEVQDMIGGFDGEFDDDERMVNPGWRELGLPVEAGEPEGRAYKFLNVPSHVEQKKAAPPAPVEVPPMVDALQGDGMNRYASETHRVECVRFKRELPGLKRQPYPGPLGERLYKEVSALAWNDWVEHAKMVINEYRMSSTDPTALSFLMEQCETYFYGDGLSAPEGFIPMA